MEKWDVYDKDGNFTGKIKTKNDIWNDEEYHLGTSVWIINNDGKILIQKRAASKRIAPNKWGTVGGSVVSGETSTIGCIREVYEEIGIKLNESELTFLQRLVFNNTLNDDYAVICDFLIEDVVMQADEVSEVKWASINEIEQIFSERLFLMGNINEMDKVKMFINTLV